MRAGALSLKRICLFANPKNTEMVHGDKPTSPNQDATPLKRGWIKSVAVLRTTPKRAPELFMNIAKAIDGDTFARLRGHGDLKRECV